MNTGELHLASIVRSSQQGTPAAVRAIVSCRARHLAGGATLLAPGRPPPATDLRRERRSGPSLGKIVAGAEMAQRVRQLACQTQPLVAHHVEAALVTATCYPGPWLFLAHTAIGPELPSYLPQHAPERIRRTLFNVASRTGTSVDRWLLGRAPACAGVAPALCNRLERLSKREVTYVPVPWPPEAPACEVPPRRDERSQQRRHGARLLFAGNLDAYQGWEDLIAVLVQLNRCSDPLAATLSVLTSSDPTALLQHARRAGVADHVSVVPLRGESDRQTAHAAADVALVPRRYPGGVSIKLLDALARGTPTVVTQRAAAGLPLGEAAEVVADSPAAMAVAVRSVLASPRRQRELTDQATGYVAREHCTARCAAALDRAFRSQLGYRQQVS